MVALVLTVAECALKKQERGGEGGKQGGSDESIEAKRLEDRWWIG